MAEAPRIFLTGPPGCGKTTLVKELARRLGPSRAAGFYTEEIRRAGERLGFRVKVLGRPAEGVLAHVDFPGGPRVGRYGVDVRAFEEAVLPSLESPVEPGRVWLIDEVGKMECLSAPFQAAVERILDGEPPALCTVPLRAAGFPLRIWKRPGALTFHLRPSNRDQVRDQIAGLLLEAVG